MRKFGFRGGSNHKKVFWKGSCFLLSLSPRFKSPSSQREFLSSSPYVSYNYQNHLLPLSMVTQVTIAVRRRLGKLWVLVEIGETTTVVTSKAFQSFTCDLVFKERSVAVRCWLYYLREGVHSSVLPVACFTFPRIHVPSSFTPSSSPSPLENG